MTDLNTATRQKRTRLISLCFASLLLLLMYGPFAHWFVAADRLVYDKLATALPNRGIENAYILSIDPARLNQSQILDRYGQILTLLKQAGAQRIVLPQPPVIAAGDPLPDWAATLATGTPVYVPTRHRFADIVRHDGFVKFDADPDGVLRSVHMWQLNDDVMSPSLPLAVAFDNEEAQSGYRLSGTDDLIFVSSRIDIERPDVDELLRGRINPTIFAGATVFVDTEPELRGAVTQMPSGEFVTHSEIVASLLAALEQDRAVIAPPWVTALEALVPALLAIVAVMFLPDRGRGNILSLAAAVIAGLLLIEMLILYVLQVRIDLGRPILIFGGIAMLSAWLIGNPSRVSKDAFKRGSDFLAAGRLEPAFAELRQCPPSDTLAAVMYKLSLAFEQQAKPERAEAVLEWMKRTHGPSLKPRATAKNGGIPQRLGRYVIEKRIGRGAMGAVYLARDPRINRPVALKAIPIDKEFEDEELKEARLRFFREAESAGRLTHPNIITVFDAGEDKGLAYIAMEYVPGIPLTSFTNPTKLLAPKRALELAACTAEGLDYAHNQGVIHRDIKPANLLYNPKEGSLKISDFGVARMTDNNRTKTGIVLGTPMYMSPEQLGAEKLTGLSDLFSLGVTLYELLVGAVPFKASNIAVLMTKITTEDPEPVSNRRAGIPPSVDAVLAKALAKQPQNRFSSGAEMAIALRNCARIS